MREGPKKFHKRRPWKEVLKDVMRGTPHRKLLRRGPTRSRKRMSHKKSWDEANKAGCERKRSGEEVLIGCPRGRSREEVVSRGPQKRLRKEVGEEVEGEGGGRRPEKKSSQEVSRGVPKDVAREVVWKTRLREEP